MATYRQKPRLENLLPPCALFVGFFASPCQYLLLWLILTGTNLDLKRPLAFNFGRLLHCI